jgi:hypothetical protein
VIARDGLVPYDSGHEAPIAPHTTPRRSHRSWLRLPQVAHS